MPMHFKRERLETVVFGERPDGRFSRFTQDSPVMPDVWFGYGAAPREPQDLLLEPYRGVQPGRVAAALQRRQSDADDRAGGKDGPCLAYSENYVAVRLTLSALVRSAIPLTGWWRKYAGPIGDLSAREIQRLLEADAAKQDAREARPEMDVPTEAGVWFLRLVGALLWAGGQKSDRRVRKLPSARTLARAIQPVLAGLDHSQPKLLWSVNRNRPAEISVCDSRKAIKADAAHHIFGLDTSRLGWAVLDTGIDAKHPAFRKRKDGALPPLGDGDFSKLTRVKQTYDFTRVRTWLRRNAAGPLDEVGGAAETRRRLLAGQAIDWELLEPELEIPHDAEYDPPGHSHGTHVAGILGGDWRRSDTGYSADDQDDLQGICPDIGLYDFRVLDDDGEGEEFSILAALQFIRYLNTRSRRPAIQGANLSLSIRHDVSNYACGRTPVCNEAERLHASGVVVVAAAGNEGYVQYLTNKGASDAYRNISITDPGNAESILTVGATHGRRPHTYGVSYFSSRGPTGDGRLKPDLVGPGEKIKGPAPGETWERLDGTSMAAPHVSGAAALLMSRHTEFIGDPARIKEILCGTATDLGRERYFQGAGLVDVSRAIQSI